MPKRDSDLLIQNKLSAIRQIESYIAGQDHDSFLHDRKTIDVVVRNLEVLGEASRQLPQEFVTQQPHVPWRLLAGLRPRLFRSGLGDYLAKSFPRTSHRSK